MKPYNGHKSWNYWNVSLWINNDEGLYNLAREARQEHRTLTEAVDYVLQSLWDNNITHTPDGARYTKAAVKAAIKDILE
jgi:hypothetical protein